MVNQCVKEVIFDSLRLKSGFSIGLVDSVCHLTDWQVKFLAIFEEIQSTD